MPPLLAALVAIGAPAVAWAASLGCNEAPGNRFFWTERGFCDLPWHGPAAAKGVVIWNHCLYGTLEQWRAPVPPVLRILQVRGWDVVAIKRHNLAEGAAGSLYRAVQRTLEEVRQQRAAGYQRIVLAGQSYGGYLTLEAAESSRGIFAAVAFAPGWRPLGGAGSLDPSVTDRILGRIAVERLVLVFPRDDALFGNVVRGPRAHEILSRRSLPYLLFDETGDITGHGGATRGRFAVRYGSCLEAFLSAPEVLPGRFTCGSVDDERDTLDLLMPAGPRASLLSEAQAAALGVAPLAGLWHTVLSDTAVLFGLVESAPESPRVLYRWADTRVGGGTYAATVRDGEVAVTFPNGVVAKPGGGSPTLTWTSGDGSRVLSAELRQVRLER
jgi:pimeloyl-ACP methyl ester carboxylesterase